eukprot:3759438-Rhodomonas_salina.1
MRENAKRQNIVAETGGHPNPVMSQRIQEEETASFFDAGVLRQKLQEAERKCEEAEKGRQEAEGDRTRLAIALEEEQKLKEER